MKIFTKMAAIVLACVLAVPGEARVNVVYQRQDCRTAAAGKGDEEETSQLDTLVRQADGGRSLCGRHAGPNEGRGAHREHP